MLGPPFNLMLGSLQVVLWSEHQAGASLGYTNSPDTEKPMEGLGPQQCSLYQGLEDNPCLPGNLSPPPQGSSDHRLPLTNSYSIVSFFVTPANTVATTL